MIFVLLSNQQYNSKLKTNKWQVANQLASKGHKVIFVDPPLRFKGLKNLSNIVEIKKNNLVVYRPINLFNFKPFSWLNTFFQIKKINKLIKDFNLDSEIILYIYHFDFPDLRNLFKKLNFDISVYDCVDIYSEFPEYAHGLKVNPSFISLIQKFDDYLKEKLDQNGLRLKDWVDNQEEWLCENCDLVFASAPGIIKRLNIWREDIKYLPNAVDFEKFNHLIKDLEPEDLQNIPHPRIGFSGAIDTYKNNINLIEKCAEKYPNYQFVLIGPEKVSDPNLNLSELKKFKNVHFLGEKPWEVTPSYFDHFDAYFIPYNINEYTVGCHPIKYFEGLASGLPTLITLDSVKEFDPDSFVNNNEDEFIKNIQIAIETNSEEKRQRRKKLASEHTWSGKVDKQIKYIQEKLILRNNTK